MKKEKLVKRMTEVLNDPSHFKFLRKTSMNQVNNLPGEIWHLNGDKTQFSYSGTTHLPDDIITIDGEEYKVLFFSNKKIIVMELRVKK